MVQEPKKRPAIRKAAPKHAVLTEAAVLDAMKKGAESELRFALTIRDLCLNETISTGRWLFASLLAINGGAAIATLNMAAYGDFKVRACIFFVAGTMFALLAGQLTGWITAAALRPINRSIVYWSGVALHGRRAGAMERSHLDAATRIVRRIFWVRAAGYASLASFAIGCAVVGMAVR